MGAICHWAICAFEPLATARFCNRANFATELWPRAQRHLASNWALACCLFWAANLSCMCELHSLTYTVQLIHSVT